MATLEQASLTPGERAALERSLAALRDELGEDLLAVWLYGSRARGERLSEDSDVDVLVVVTDRERLDRRAWDAVREASCGNELSAHVTDPRGLAEDAAIESLFLREVERDRIVLWGGENTPLAPLEEHELPPKVGPGGVLTRSLRWLKRGRGYLAAAERAFDADIDSGVIASTSYYAMFYALRAALSEDGRVARKHAGAWHLADVLYVADGRLDGALVNRGREMQKQREGADYEAWSFEREESRAQIDDARRFVAAIEQLIGADHG